MRTNLIITDNFLGNPDSVREFALKQEFNVKGNYPGTRTRSFLTPDLKEALQTIVWNAGGEITNWFEQDGYTGAFQLTTAADRSWVHTDHFNKWAGVLYLTPDAPVWEEQAYSCIKRIRQLQQARWLMNHMMHRI